jgi:hypothetical protein
MTEGEAETKRQKAIEFLERIGGDADKFRDMDAAEYADHKGAELLPNPFKRSIKMTKSEMAETLDQLADGLGEALDPELTREELVSKVKDLADIAAGEDDDTDGDDNGSDDNGEGDDQD